MSEQDPLPGMNVDSVQVVDREHVAERRIFEERLGELPLGGLYQDLVEKEGWYWRDAAFIAWKSLPKEIRQPATLGELANLLGCSRRTIHDRRQKNPGIDKRVSKLSVNVVFRGIGDVLEALMESAREANYKSHPDRKLALELAGIYKPRHGLVLDEDWSDADEIDYGELSEAELKRIAKAKGAGEQGVSRNAPTEEEDGDE